MTFSPIRLTFDGGTVVVTGGGDEDQGPGRDAAVIGAVVADHAGLVVMRSLVGGERVVTLLAGEQLPRIC